MTIAFRLAAAACAFGAVTIEANPAQASHPVESLSVAYFQEWPLPFQYAKATGQYAAALGVPVTWISYPTGPAMTRALLAGEVQIAIGLGMPPMTSAVSGGADLAVLDIAVGYSEQDNCVAHADLGIDTHAHEHAGAVLDGARVAVPLGTAAHYGLLRQLIHFDVDIATLTLRDMTPNEGAAALATGEVDMACGWGVALEQMQRHGAVLMTDAEKEDLGIMVFDVTTARLDFIATHADEITRFLAVTAAANRAWTDGVETDAMIALIAEDAGMEIDAARQRMAGFQFPGIEEQLGRKWLNGGVQEFMVLVAQVFGSDQELETLRARMESVIDAGPLGAVARVEDIQLVSGTH